MTGPGRYHLLHAIGGRSAQHGWWWNEEVARELAVEDSETLYRALFLAHHAADDIDALREAAARLRRINDSIGGGGDMEPDTAELLRNLLPRPIHTR